MFLKCFCIAVPYMYVLLCVLHLCVIKDDDKPDIMSKLCIMFVLIFCDFCGFTKQEILASEN